MKTESYRVKVTFINPILGSQPAENVASVYIANRAGMPLPEDEVETLPDALDRGTTVFHKDASGRPVLWDYQIRGFLKAAAQVLNGKVSGNVRNLRSKVNSLVFVSPRLIRINGPDDADVRDLLDYLERPLRAQTAQGDRVALARSEMLPEGCSVTFGLEVLPGEISQGVIEDLLDYGFYSGLGQWRNGGWGNFRYELVRES